MRDIKEWEAEGFVFNRTFEGEYDLYMHKRTCRCLRRYVDGSEWLADDTGRYQKVGKPTSKGEEPCKK